MPASPAVALRRITTRFLCVALAWLAPALAGAVESAGGRPLGVIRPIAKESLVDSDFAIRNIYSSGFLDHDILFRGIETVLLEE